MPCFDDFYATALDVLPFEREAELEILDLGAGTGLLSLLVAEAFPKAKLTLVDVSGEMLARARERFRDRGGEVRFVEADFQEFPLEGPYDAVVSALAIHHLDLDAKLALFERIHARLCPGGIFMNADQLAGETPGVDAANREAWKQAAIASGATDQQLAAAIDRMREDQPSTLEEQLNGLRRVGFADATCWFKAYMFAVYSGRRSSG